MDKHGKLDFELGLAGAQLYYRVAVLLSYGVHDPMKTAPLGIRRIQIALQQLKPQRIGKMHSAHKSN